MLRCSKCNKVMEAEDGTRVIGGKVSVELRPDTSPTMQDLYMESLGPYAANLFNDGGSLKLEIALCYECWLNSLLGKHEH